MKKITIVIMLAFICACVQEMRDITIHFSVDMSKVENVQSVGVIGENDPLTWDNPIELQDSDGDGIYEGVITIRAAYNYAEFKFMLNKNIIELEGKGNRQVDFTDMTEVRYSGTFDQDLN
jgi:hypothetical protein